MVEEGPQLKPFTFVVSAVISVLLGGIAIVGWYVLRYRRNKREEDALKSQSFPQLKQNILPSIIGNQPNVLDAVLSHIAHRSSSDSSLHFDLNRPSFSGTYLHFAARAGHPAIVSTLIRHGADINAVDGNGETPLHVASKNGHLSTVETLINEGADINHRNHNGWSPLHWCAVSGREKGVRILIQAGADVDSADSKRGWTPVLFAAYNGHATCLDFLLNEANGSLNSIDIEGNNVFHLCARNGSPACLRIILQKENNLSDSGLYARNSAHKLPIQIACGLGHREFVKSVLDWDDSSSSSSSSSPNRPILSLIEMLSQIQMKSFSRSTSTQRQREDVDARPREEQIEEEAEDPQLTSSHPEESEENVRAVLEHLAEHPRYLDAILGGLGGRICEISASFLEISEDSVSPRDKICEEEKLYRRCMNRWMEMIAAARQKTESDSIEKHSERQAVIETHLEKLEANVWSALDSSLHHIITSGCTAENDPKGKGKETSFVFPAFAPLTQSFARRMCPLLDSFYLFCTQILNSSKRFDEFLDRHAAAIQAIAAQDLDRLVVSLDFVLDHQGMMSSKNQLFGEIVERLGFERKRKWLRRQLRKDREAAKHRAQRQTSSPRESVVIVVHREGTRLLQESCASLVGEEGEGDPSSSSATIDALKRGEFRVRFAEEEGVGAGVRREWFQLIAREMFNPDNALFRLSTKDSVGGGTFQPNPNSQVNPDHLSYFQFVGRIVGLAIYHQETLPVFFTQSFYKHILGERVSVSDLEAIDPVYAKNLRWIEEHDEVDELGLTFCAEVEVFGERRVVELVPGGSEVPVTKENRSEYVQRVTESILTDSIRLQTASFLRGFNEMIPPRLIRVFNFRELELLISGLPTIDVEDWKNNAEYVECKKEDLVVEWFWKLVQERMSEEDRALLLQFVTGSSRVPLGGFAMLRGLEGLQKFVIRKVKLSDPLQLPTASTCFNLLKLPEYSDERQLCDRVLVAIRCGSEGFVFS